MSNQEIRVGQEWSHKDGRGFRIERISGKTAHGEPLDGKGYMHVETSLLSETGWGWTLTKEAPDSPPRFIRLPLAPDTTATECGKCPALGGSRDDYCQRFDERLYVPSDLPEPDTSYRAQRSAKCIAAEVS